MLQLAYKQRVWVLQNKVRHCRRFRKCHTVYKRRTPPWIEMPVQWPTAAAGSEAQARHLVDSGQYVRTAYGFSAESLPLVETISPQFRQSIISGRDVNLAAMLIPYYSGPCNDSTEEINTTKQDPRLSRTLSIGEFIQAFGTYKSVQHIQTVEMNLIYTKEILWTWHQGTLVKVFMSTIDNFHCKQQHICTTIIL
jgi:hypothetical protein